VADDLSIPTPSYRAGRQRRTTVRQKNRMEPGTRRLLTFAGGVAGVLVALVGASFISGHHSGQIPVVAADPAPIRVKPAHPGGLKIDATANDVFAEGSDIAGARLAPAAEAPDPTALKAVEASAMPAHPAAPAPASAARTLDSAPVRPGEPAAAGLAAAGVGRPALTARPAAGDTRAADTRAGDTRAGAKTAGDPRIIVQLAALGTEAEAKAEWERLRGKFHELLDGRTLIVSRTVFRGRTWWRVRTSGFADAAQAHAFCDHLHAKGGGCSVVAP
jgi:hypothetical protein